MNIEQYATKLRGMRIDRKAFITAIICLFAVMFATLLTVSLDSDAVSLYGSQSDPYGSVSIDPAEASDGTTYYVVTGGYVWVGEGISEDSIDTGDLLAASLSFDSEKGIVYGTVSNDFTLTIDGKHMNFVVVSLLTVQRSQTIRYMVPDTRTT